MIELLAAIIEATDEALRDHQDLSLFPGEYMDGTPAEPDITEIEIEKIDFNPEFPGLWIEVTIQQQGGWTVFLQSNHPGEKLYSPIVTTLEGYCRPGCICDWCQIIRQNYQSEAVA
jgi:hypothetical protein